MIAQVIVNQNSKQVDKFFDYLVPKELESNILQGHRVIVPFGASNKQIEAYVMQLVDKSNAKRLKKIISIVEPKPTFDAKMLQLIDWMRDKYLCSYLDIIKTIVPSGIVVKPQQWVVLISTDSDIKLSDTKKKTIKILSENSGAMEINRLMQMIGKNIKNQLNQMHNDELIRYEYREQSDIKDKTVRLASLSVSAEEGLSEALKIAKKAPVQARVLEVLCSNEFLSLSDLVQFSEGTYNVINALEKKGLIKFEDRIIERNPLLNKHYDIVKPPKLTPDQEYVIEKINEQIKQCEYPQILLHGVTGSGKTEVYMRLIDDALNQGKTAIMLVPEISLTPQTVARFLSRFGERVAIFHSRLSMGERYDEWKKMRDGRADIVIGARSAIFAPLDNIGIIVIDEEHEQSYKSEMVPRYNAKEVAEYRAKQYNATIIYASATPSMESYYKARKQNYVLLNMKNRANKSAMPEVSIVDMRQELERGNKSIFSERLKSEIEKNIEKGEQTILFLNRRGFSTFVSCRSCGFVAKCPNCNISLTYHRYKDELKCHYCGYTINNYTVCPDCESKYIRYFGGGTQKVEEEITKLFPTATTIRMDVDTTGKKAGHEKILDEFEKSKIDILIGTQMVSKGLDFANVTLVGVISADTMLNIDDYRSGERTFSVLEQVAGRAGRAKKLGRAIVQTYNPEHDAITFMQRHDYIGFYKSEMQMRLAMWYPPFCDIISILIIGSGETLVQQASKFLKKQLAPLDKIPQKIQVLGPIPASISKINNKYRWRILIKCENADELNMILTDATNACYNNKSYERVSIVIDKNPNSIG